MPHQCVHCSKMYPDASKELLTGCTCGSHFFYYIKKEYAEKLKKEAEATLSEALDVQETIKEINKVDKFKIEKDVREMIGLANQEDIPVILDLESIKILGPGKFEIDVVNLFTKKRPLIYKLEEGKYIIDLASTLKLNAAELKELKKIDKTKPK